MVASDATPRLRSYIIQHTYILCVNVDILIMCTLVLPSSQTSHRACAGRKVSRCTRTPLNNTHQPSCMFGTVIVVGCCGHTATRWEGSQRCSSVRMRSTWLAVGGERALPFQQPLRYRLLTPGLQWQPRGQGRILQGFVHMGNARARLARGGAHRGRAEGATAGFASGECR